MSKFVVMSKNKRAYFNWSSGKDSALALYRALESKEFKITKLLTSISTEHQRVTMHGLHLDLLKKQCQHIGLPLECLALPSNPSMETYEKVMNERMTQMKANGFDDCFFGDIFLEDLKAYRENQLQRVGIQAHFPLWKSDTKKLSEEFLTLGFRAIVVCINGRLLDESFVGREYNADFIWDLPSNVDPCGENGEFHTFCFDGPIFSTPVPCSLGKKITQVYPAGETTPETPFHFVEVHSE